VADALRACLPDARIETVIIKTKGDRILDKPLGEIGDKGLFVSELEAALLEEKVDLAVHSAKDLPMCLAEGLEILAVPQRADARDVLVQVRKKGSEGTGPEGAKEGFASLPPRPVIGTGSFM
jgi:hydroxymethylbilane synthase